MSDCGADEEVVGDAGHDGDDGEGAGRVRNDGEHAGRHDDDGENAVQDGDDGRPDVPEGPEAVAAGEHVLPLEDLQYPTLTLASGTVRDDGGVEGARELDREAMATWLEDLAGGLASHDVAVEAPDGRVTLGVAPEGAEIAFDPGDNGVGDLEISFTLRAKSMVVNDPDDPSVGARGGKGFVPLAMLTDDADPEEYRCYNWIDDPTDG